jgi:hypothetical protein
MYKDAKANGICRRQRLQLSEILRRTLVVMGCEPTFEITELRTGPPSIPDFAYYPRIARVPRHGYSSTSHFKPDAWRKCAKYGMPDLPWHQAIWMRDHK